MNDATQDVRYWSPELGNHRKAKDDWVNRTRQVFFYKTDPRDPEVY